MPALGLILLTVLGVGIALRAPLRYAFGTLLAFLLLVPITLVVPGVPFPQVLIDRVVLYAFVAGLPLRFVRGELGREVFRPTAVHLAFGVFLLLAFALGVVLGPSARFIVVLSPWLQFLDGFLVFASVVVAVRALGDLRWVVGLTAAVVFVASGIGIVEYFTEASWGRWLSQGVPEHARTLAGRPLGSRGGTVRVRGAGAFPLDFAWVLVILTPFAVAAAARTRRVVVKILVAGPPLAVFWTFSRSAVVGLVVILVVFWMASRFDRMVAVLLIGGVLISLGIAVLNPVTFEPFSSEQAEDSVETRVSKLSRGANLAAERPIIGHGFAGLRERGLAATDMSYLHVYGQLGVLGLTSLGVLLMVAFVFTARGIRGPPSSSLAAAAGAATIVGGALAAASYDFFGLGSILLWFGVGIGVAAAERHDPDLRNWVVVPTPRRLIPAAAGLGVGLVIAFTATSHAGQEYVLDALPATIEADSLTNPNNVGEIFINAGCGVAESVVADRPDVSIACRHAQFVWTGRLEVRAPDVETVEEVRRDLSETFDALLLDAEIYPLEPPESGKATVARTGPIWLPFGLLLLGLLLPGRRDHRRPRRKAPPEGSGVWEPHASRHPRSVPDGAGEGRLQPR